MSVNRYPTIRVCMIAPAIYPLFNSLARSLFTDADLQLYELAHYFRQDERIEVQVLTGDFGQDEAEFYSGVLVVRGDFDYTRKGLNRWLRRPSPFEALLDKMDADIYMMASACDLVDPVAEYCRRRGRVFFYRVSHQRDCDGTFIHGDPAGAAFRQALHQAGMIVCQTEQQSSLLRRTENLSAMVVPNAVRIEPASEAVRNDVLWVGEAVEWKQPELFYRLALTIPQQNFTILTRPWNFEYFERLVSKNRDVPNLGFENTVPVQEWSNYFQRAKLLVNTSRFDGFPDSFAKAFAEGIPVISLNVDPDDILEKHQIGLCAQGSEVRLAQGVMDLLAYPRQWMRLSGNARTYAQSTHHTRLIGETYRQLFLKCAGMALRRGGR